MSSLIIKTVQLTNLRPHPNADRLELGNCGAWQVVLQKGKYSEGDLVVFIPPDAVIEEALHTQWGVSNYLASLPQDYVGAGPGARRVKAARLRGQPSYGLVVDLPDFSYQDDSRVFYDDIAAYWGITKYEPLITDKNIEVDHPAFHKYTSIERYQNFPHIIPDGEIVVITEKIHGVNCRVGIVPDVGWIAGSFTARRKEVDEDTGLNNLYWLPLKSPNYINLQVMIEATFKKHQAPVIVFGELYGGGIQDMNYGLPTAKGFRVFDITINGQYLSYAEKRKLLESHGVEAVPQLYRGPMSAEVVQKYTDGPTVVGESTGKFKGREGVVITPVVERHDPTIGRVILKSISVDYLERKGATDGH